MDLKAAERLQSVNDFDSLLPYLREELDWPVEDYGFDDLTFQYTAQELGLDDQSAAKVTAIRRLRPLDDEQPWGIFFLELEPKRLPVVALRRVLSKMTLKKRASSNRSDSPAWHADDILFISRTGESDERHLTFAHFAANPAKADLPVLKVLGWDASDTVLRIDHVAEVLKEKLVWPEDPSDSDRWRKQWRDAFTLKHREQVTTAKEMASRLAELARGIRGAIREVLAVESENGPLTKIMDAFRESLVHDLDPEQFADTYAQTITYGLLSARITDPSKNTLDDLASHMQTNPFLKELMESFIDVGGRKKNDSGVGLDFDELGVSDVIELLDNANMEAVVRDFGKNNQQEDPVIHFFEGFLQEYDKSIRKDRGVFYTPRPVVSFIIRSVDELLRTEFGLEDGLADTTTWGEMAARIDGLEIPEGATATQAFVQILDPATGTGTFLVEVIDLIHKTMTAKWQAEGHGNKKIEKLWNDYVPEHLLPRLHGYELMMAPYAIAHMKIGLKLYETGYRFESAERARVYLTNALEPAQDFSGTLAFAIPALAHEAEAVNAIKRDQRFTVVIGNPPYSGHSSNTGEWITELVRDYYFVDGEPLGERNPKWLQDDYVKFIRLGEHYIAQADIGIQSYITNHGYIDNPTFRGFRQQITTSFAVLDVLDLHGNTTKKELSPDGSPDQNVFDIKQGVAVFAARRKPSSEDAMQVLHHRHVFGLREAKYEELSNSTLLMGERAVVKPTSPFYLFIPQDVVLKEEYETYIGSIEAFPVNVLGFQTHRDAVAIGPDREALIGQVEDFLGRNLSGREKADFVSRSAYRLFDERYAYLNTDVCDRPRRELLNHVVGRQNLCLGLGRQGAAVQDPIWSLVTISRYPFDANIFRRGGINVFPLWIFPQEAGLAFSGDVEPNFSTHFYSRLLRSLSISASVDGDILGAIAPEDVFLYTYAVLHSNTYRSRYNEFLKTDFPRIPLPGGPEIFTALTAIGKSLANLHLMEFQTLMGREVSSIGLDECEVEKVAYSDETVWIDKAKTRGFKGVPEEVWNFHIGGYQVCEKWLKDRQAKGGKSPRPGRVLTDEDIEHYQKIVVALSETIRIMAEIDEVIEAHGGWPGAFQTGDAGDEPVSDVVYAEADDGASQLDMVAEPKDG